MTDSAASPNSPGYVCAALRQRLPTLEMLRALHGGTDALREAGEKYLPRFPLESPETWRLRLSSSVTSGDFARSIQKIIGILLEDGIDLGAELPPIVTDHWQDIDLADSHGDRFMARALAAALRDGVAFILVDAPREGGRPYWTLRERTDVVNWRHTRVGGALRLVQVTLREVTPEPDGAFGEKLITRYRRLYLDGGRVSFELFREVSDERGEVTYVLEDAGQLPLGDIPLVPLYANAPTAPFVAESPLLALAHRELEYYQTYSDYKYNLHLAAVAILVARGIPEGETIRIAPSAVALLSNEQSLEYVEITGAAIGAMQACLAQIRADMSELGVPVGDTRNRTATEAMHLQTLRMATLRDIAVSVRDAVESALWWHLTWLGLPTDGVRGGISVAPRLDLSGATSQDLALLAQARRDGEIDAMTYLEALQRAGLLPPGVTPQMVMERLGNEWQMEPEQ